MEVILTSLGALVIFKSLTQKRHKFVHLNHNHRRNHDSPMAIATFRAAGQLLPESEHGGSALDQHNIPVDLTQVRNKFSHKQSGNNWLLNTWFFNTKLLRRQQTNPISDEVATVHPHMGSGWYQNAAASFNKPHRTKVIPHTYF